MKLHLYLTIFLLFGAASGYSQGIAYGSITNFDTVNDTGRECHGFEIEIEDCDSLDITHTYNYNHYGVPKITEDLSNPDHPKCYIRWESKKNPDGSWAAYTAIPAGPIDPTNGHQFTNPNVNFGGEHFGVGYRVAVGKVSYHWLVDDGHGNLIRGGAVQVAAPQFKYYPGLGGGVGQVQAAIRPAPEEQHVKEFGTPVWVKEIKTTSHSKEKIRLRELVSDDPDDPDDKNWTNGEPDEVEVEWQLLQEEFGQDDGGGNGELEGAPEDLEDEDEVVTRRYEFYEYIGPLDEENGEAKAEKVGPDGIHGEGIKRINGVEIDLSTVEVVGEYKGAQMAAVDVQAAVSLIDQLSEGVVNERYPSRLVIVQGSQPFNGTFDGDLPNGMSFDEIAGVLEGTPTEAGEYQFKVTAIEADRPAVAKTYTLVIAAANGAGPVQYLVDTTVAELDAGTTSGDGAYESGSDVTVTAAANPGYAFSHWTENNQVVSETAEYTFTLNINQSLVAHFVESQDPGWPAPAGWMSWIQEQYGELASDVEITGPQVDYDLDGETTLQEFVFGHNPTLSDAEPPTAQVDAVQGLMLTFTRPLNHAGLTYEVQVTTDINAGWQSGAGMTEVVDTQDDGVVETVTVRSLLPLSEAPQQYMRIRVTW